jgi:hypothetical protein
LHDLIKSQLKTGVQPDLDDKVMSLLLGHRNLSDMPKAKHVHDFLRVADKTLPGVLRSYDLMSEYAHPNWSGVALVYSHNDHENLLTNFGSGTRANASRHVTLGLECLLGSLMMLEFSYNRITDDMPDFVGIPHFSMDALLVPERANEFWFAYRQAYNYFKHADLDADEELEVHDIVASNELGIFLNVIVSQQIGIPLDNHTQPFLTYMLTYYPGIERLVRTEIISQLGELREHFVTHTRGEMLGLLKSLLEQSPGAQEERRTDLIDVIEAARTRPR